jgi:hypothetical protein
VPDQPPAAVHVDALEDQVSETDCPHETTSALLERDNVTGNAGATPPPPPLLLPPPPPPPPHPATQTNSAVSTNARAFFKALSFAVISATELKIALARYFKAAGYHRP